MNGDSQLSREEARARTPRPYAHFEYVDANGDGYLTPDDVGREIG